MNVNVKRTLCMCAAALLVSAAGAGAVSAAEPAVQVPAAQNQQSTTLGYAQIDQLVRNNNPQVRNNALTRRNMDKNGNANSCRKPLTVCSSWCLVQAMR